MQPWEAPRLEEVRDEHRRFAAQELSRTLGAEAGGGLFPMEAWRACAGRGLLSSCLDGAAGGAGKPLVESVAAVEGLGMGCEDGGLVYAVASQLFGIQMPLTRVAPPELLRRYFPDVLAGKLLLAHAFTEEVAGSDALSMETSARKDGESYRLSGAKCFVTNAPVADLALVFARTRTGRSPRALSAFLVDLRSPGVKRGRRFDKLGLRTVPMGELLFDEVAVPADHLVGGLGGGMMVLAETTAWERGVLLCAALGPMARVLEQAIAWARSRKQFNRPIGAFQAVSSRIADMTVRLRMSRLAIYDMASRLQVSRLARSLAEEAAVTKLFVSESYVEFELAALQHFGVRGYLSGSPVQEGLRDALSSTIYAGTSDIMRNIIAAFAGLRFPSFEPG